MMKRWMLALAAAASLSLLTGCSLGGPKTVTIDVKEMAYAKQAIVLKAGQPVELVLVNNDTEVHDLSVDTIPITAGTEAAAADDHDHGGKNPDLHVSAKPGQKRTLRFTPIEEGTYIFYCTVPGHLEHGMQGTLVVSATGKAPKAN